MTRTHTKSPVWVWKCDLCFREHFLGKTSQELPSLDEMRELGWYIAKLYGDRCPECFEKENG